MKIKLDAAVCASATCPPGKRKVVLWDTIIKGFTLELRPSGGTYALRYNDEHGTQRQHKIGGLGEISAADARKTAERLRSNVVLGGNPAAKKAEKKAIPTYATLADQHIDYAKTYQKNPGNTESVIVNHVLPRWGKMRLDEITSPIVATWLAEKRAEGLAPATVEKIRIMFNRSFELALKWDTPGVIKNPVRGIPRPKLNNARERFLSAAEAGSLIKAADASSNQHLGAIVRLLLLTGARKNELLKARWEHVDIDGRRTWFIPTSKTGRSRHVPLSQAAVDVIRGIPKLKDCPWLLPNPKTRKPYHDIKRVWATARKAAGLDDLHIHDCRHAAASFMIAAGIDLFHVGRILGHADHQSTMRYSHLANDTLMKAVEAGAAKMFSIA